ALADLARADAAALEALARRASPHLGDLISALRELRRLRREFGVTDFDDLVSRAAALAHEPGSRVAAHLHSGFDHVLVDEFQDTDPHQVALLEAISATIFAVGDSAQAIYGFRGAARNAIERAVQALAMERVPLRVSHRCAPAICEAIGTTPGLPPAQRIETQVAERGEVRVERAATPLDEAELAADHVAAALARGIAPGRVAVLLRASDPFGPYVYDALQRRGIRAARIGGDALVREPVVRTLVDALRALVERREARWIDCFCSPVLGYARLALVRAFGRSHPNALDDALAALSGLGDARVPFERIAATLRAAADDLARGAIADAARTIARGFDLLGAAATLDDAAAARAGARLEAAIEAIDDTAEVVARAYGRVDAADVLTRVERDAAEAGDEPDRDAVAILTIHAAKGLEFDTVVLCDAADGRMPVELRRDGVVPEGDVAIARELGIDLGVRADEHLAEERSLWYVALSRAERCLVITSSASGADGAPQFPSRFLALAERERVAQLPPYFGALTYGGSAALPLRAQPRPAPIPATFGVTRLDDWFSCERKFFYATVLKLPSESAFSKSFGIGIHRTIERYHQVVKRIDAAWNLDEAIAALVQLRAAVWSEVDIEFASSLERDAAAASADRLLRRYAEHLGAERDKQVFEVERLEAAVQVPLGERTLRGTIDRFDRLADGTSRIVDIKTGKQYTKLAKGLAKFVESVDAEDLYGESAPDIASVQLPLYRRGLDGADTLALLHLRTDDGDAVELDEVSDAGDLLASVDAAIERGFTQRIDGIEQFATTRDARVCERCAYAAICDGALEAIANA
ncbi:MAG: ATP-dependent helicase, partial [bacterium]|nr:ATP-dependent helicase [bacterium]